LEFDEGLELYGFDLRLATTYVDDVLPVDLDLLCYEVLHELAYIHSLFAGVSGLYTLFAVRIKLRSEIVDVVLDQVVFFQLVELVDQVLQRQLSLFDLPSDGEGSLPFHSLFHFLFFCLFVCSFVHDRQRFGLGCFVFGNVLAVVICCSLAGFIVGTLCKASALAGIASLLI